MVIGLLERGRGGRNEFVVMFETVASATDKNGRAGGGRGGRGYVENVLVIFVRALAGETASDGVERIFFIAFFIK